MSCIADATLACVEENGCLSERLADLSTPRKSAYPLGTAFDVSAPIEIESIGSADLLLFPQSTTPKVFFRRLRKESAVSLFCSIESVLEVSVGCGKTSASV